MSSILLSRATRGPNSSIRSNLFLSLSSKPPPPPPSLILTQRTYSSKTKHQQATTQESPSLSGLNPPPTTRPPPLNLPARDPKNPAFKHYFSLGKAYLTFYKTGLKNILTNRKLALSNPLTQSPPSRALILLHSRYAHDIRRLPLFGLLLLVCGEFTPLIVLLVPKIVPLTCRIPKQVELLLRRQEQARERVRGDESIEGEERRLGGILGVSGYRWLPLSTVGKKVAEKVGEIRRDGEMILSGGGVKEMKGEEVRLALVERGVGVLGRGERELRGVLARWLEIVKGEKGGSEERIKKLISLGEGRWEEVEEDRGE
ncbi:hypothetical protein QBC44DRAFT_358094 [Cladorrhinum sp. PSN332]|nr:hypothetical protein QBC44DRAFT_358094 [Cladorrhinum sp. PSN332]